MTFTQSKKKHILLWMFVLRVSMLKSERSHHQINYSLPRASKLKIIHCGVKRTAPDDSDSQKLSCEDHMLGSNSSQTWYYWRHQRSFVTPGWHILKHLAQIFQVCQLQSISFFLNCSYNLFKFFFLLRYC